MLASAADNTLRVAVIDAGIACCEDINAAPLNLTGSAGIAGESGR